MTITQFASAIDWTVVKGGAGDFETIQEAIAAASDGDVINVLPGIYVSTSENVVDTLGKAITLQSTEGAEKTFIDGQHVRRGIICQTGETMATLIEGFTITNCNAPDPVYSPARGGGILCVNSAPRFEDCIISNNTAPVYTSEFGTLPGYGGGIAVIDYADITLNNCLIMGNTADVLNGETEQSKGGGVYAAIYSKVTITNCEITYNTASTGGGLCLDGINNYPSMSIIDHTYIANNEAVHSQGKGGGGLMCYSNALDLISHCTIEYNTATRGGGIRCHTKGAEPTIARCFIEHNTATETLAAGGLQSDGGTKIGAMPVLEDNTFCENIHVATWGNYVDAGGNIFNESCCNSDVNGDGYIGVDDILVLVSLWESDDAQADINNDGIVGTDDLLQLIADWGPCL
ncbi:MAG: hypothetical protein H8E91_03670 [Planctomycetes bacterium]|nr:hypothetical protein [Planctomycetota bacterium]